MPVLTPARSEELAIRTLMRCRTAEAAQAKVGKVDGFACPAIEAA